MTNLTNKKVSELPIATAVAPTDVLLVVQGGVTKQVAHDTIAAAVAASTEITSTYVTFDGTVLRLAGNVIPISGGTSGTVGGGGAWSNPTDNGAALDGGSATTTDTGTALDGGTASSIDTGSNYDDGSAAA